MKLTTHLQLVLKNEWSYTSAPPICLYGVDRDSITFFKPFPAHSLRDYIDKATAAPIFVKTQKYLIFFLTLLFTHSEKLVNFL